MYISWDNYYNQSFKIIVHSGSTRIEEEVTNRNGKISEETIQEVEDLLYRMKEFNEAQDKKESKDGK